MQGSQRSVFIYSARDAGPLSQIPLQASVPGRSNGRVAILPRHGAKVHIRIDKLPMSSVVKLAWPINVFRGAKPWSLYDESFFHGVTNERLASRRVSRRVFSGWLVFHDAIWRWTDGHGEKSMRDCLIALVWKGTRSIREEREREREKHDWWNLTHISQWNTSRTVLRYYVTSE